MSKTYKISIIGSGNVAWHLSQALENAGHHVLEIYSRNLAHAKKLSSRLYNAFATDNLNFTQSHAQLFFIAVADDAIEGVVTDIRIPENAIIAHTSGTKSLDVFNLLYHHAGVFYPLQTFSKGRKIDFEEVPLCLESTNEATLKILSTVAKSISKEIHFFNSEKRKVLHIAAVFACNFTNHLLAISKEILEEENIDYGILNPVISETINKALDYNPKDMQTGPAIRKDIKVLQEHLSLLKNDVNKKEIYRILSESILKSKK